MNVELMGLKVNTYNFQEALEFAKELINQDKVSQVVTVNPEMFQYASSNKEFANIVNSSELVVPDGVGVKIALKLNGINVERIPGVDFAEELLKYSAKSNIPIAIIGAKEEVLQKAVENIKIKYPNINIVYSHNGYFTDVSTILNEIKNTNPRLILVATGSPKQEQFISKAKSVLNYGLMIGIGGSLDVWSGAVKRAPKIFRKTGTEWVYRTLIQPERFKRIFPTLPLFLIKSILYRMCCK
ncbi:MAG: WecB/TagA/CpsF family glycosyltransferase [bacterium]|nr:WecB/TagA/CpsF family glycosyltransferase [bacterium]